MLISGGLGSEIAPEPRSYILKPTRNTGASRSLAEDMSMAKGLKIVVRAEGFLKRNDLNHGMETKHIWTRKCLK